MPEQTADADAVGGCRMPDAEADGGPLMQGQTQEHLRRRGSTVRRWAIADAGMDGSCESKRRGRRAGHMRKQTQGLKRMMGGSCKRKRTGHALAGESARAKANAVAKCFSWNWASKKVGARVVGGLSHSSMYSSPSCNVSSIHSSNVEFRGPQRPWLVSHSLTTPPSSRTTRPS